MSEEKWEEELEERRGRAKKVVISSMDVGTDKRKVLGAESMKESWWRSSAGPRS